MVVDISAMGQSDPCKADNGEQKSHGEALVRKQPMNLDVMELYAQTQICQKWMARSSVVFMVTCFDSPIS